MEITAAAAHQSPSAASHVLAYFLLALLVFVVFAGVASIFSRRWRPIAVRVIAFSAGGLISLYLVGRAIAEFFVVNYSDPASYRSDWGGPSLAGVFAVHAGPGIAIVIAAIVGLYRRRPPPPPRGSMPRLTPLPSPSHWADCAIDIARAGQSRNRPR